MITFSAVQEANNGTQAPSTKFFETKKYIGDALLQKTYNTNILNNTGVKNNDLVLQYYVKDNH